MVRCNVIGLSIGLFLLASVAEGGIIVNASLSGSPGIFSYGYAIENQTAVSIFSFSLTVTGDVGNIQSPNGWFAGTVVPSPGETLVEWVDLDVPFDVPAFGTLSGFQITSASGPGTAAFSTLDENFTQFDGQTTGPAPPPITTTPEPAGWILIGTALIAICAPRAMGYWVRR